MPLTPYTNPTNYISQLDDLPNDVGGLTADELKAEFDKPGTEIKSYINDTLIPELSPSTINLGGTYTNSTPFTGIATNTIFDFTIPFSIPLGTSLSVGTVVSYGEVYYSGNNLHVTPTALSILGINNVGIRCRLTIPTVSGTYPAVVDGLQATINVS